MSLREHFRRSGKNLLPKKAFNSYDDALVFCEANGIKDKNIYKCSWCGKYHIGG